MLWVGKSNGPLGDGTFVFVPGRNGLTFKRPGSGEKEVIQPTPFYTDGGSVPRLVQAFEGFESWGYAPAYIIHDYLFVIQRCLPGSTTATEAEKRIAALKFADSYAIMAEAMKALVKQGKVPRNDGAQDTIVKVVSGPITRSMWNNGTCEKVTAQHMAEVAAAIPGNWAESTTNEAPALQLRGGKTLIELGEIEF